MEGNLMPAAAARSRASTLLSSSARALLSSSRPTGPPAAAAAAAAPPGSLPDASTSSSPTASSTAPSPPAPSTAPSPLTPSPAPSPPAPTPSPSATPPSPAAAAPRPPLLALLTILLSWASWLCMVSRATASALLFSLSCSTSSRALSWFTSLAPRFTASTRAALSTLPSSFKDTAASPLPAAPPAIRDPESGCSSASSSARSALPSMCLRSASRSS
mmetsp:Transcript_28874/g.63615  ORF Transcript_28874/g.63615 Transcript_28874/m.63615 type:complete len:217 (+) Transcript_28874:2637-3287(+)